MIRLMCLLCHSPYHSKPYRCIRGVYEQPKGKKVQGRRMGNCWGWMVPAVCEDCGGRKRHTDEGYKEEKGCEL
jgi:hypothetical protein